MRGTACLIAMALVSGASPARGQSTHPFAAPLDWQSEAREYRSAVVRAYMALLDEVRKGWLSGDMEQALRPYTNDATVVVADGVLAQGREGVRAALQELLPRVVEVRMGLSDFATSDRLAYGIGPVRLRVRDESGAEVEVSGTYIVVAMRDGRNWKVRSQVLRYDGQPGR